MKMMIWKKMKRKKKRRRNCRSLRGNKSLNSSRVNLSSNNKRQKARKNTIECAFDERLFFF